MGCNLMKAMKKPLTVPTAAPISSAATPKAICEAAPSPMEVARTTFTSEMTAPAERSKPPVKMTIVCPMAAKPKGAAPADMKLNSK